jgi:protocatechuate 3,4-dioxygenase beta subunit
VIPRARPFVRAPHIHFDVRGRDQRLITQLYFPGDGELQAQDQVIAHDLALFDGEMGVK